MKIAAISIGQSPSPQTLEDIFRSVCNPSDIREYGVLDGLSISELSNFSPIDDKDILLCGLKERYSVVVSKKYVEMMMFDLVNRLKKTYDYVLILCSERFNFLQNDKQVVFPSQLLLNDAKSLSVNSAEVLVPIESQIEQAQRYWSQHLLSSQCRAVSLKGEGVEEVSGPTVIMDCIGYSEQMRSRVSSLVKGTVIDCRSSVRKFFHNQIF